MDQETRKHIFKRFFTTKKHENGAGLGLATVYDLVQQMDGTIDIDRPVFVNFAISGIERRVRALRAALQGRTKEVSVARKVAEGALRNELKGTVTAMLLSCEMALQVQGLPMAAQVKLQAIDELAREMRRKLGMAAGV
jgi:hypothetical protein